MREVTRESLTIKISFLESLICLYWWLCCWFTARPHGLWNNPGPETEVQLGVALLSYEPAPDLYPLQFSSFIYLFFYSPSPSLHTAWRHWGDNDGQSLSQDPWAGEESFRHCFWEAFLWPHVAVPLGQGERMGETKDSALWRYTTVTCSQRSTVCYWGGFEWHTCTYIICIIQSHRKQKCNGQAHSVWWWESYTK